MSAEAGDSTRHLLLRLGRGDTTARDELLPRLYDELHGIAGRLMARQGGAHTLQATALVHEAWLKLVRVEDRQDWEGRAHFLRIAASAMRSVLVDHARARHAERRGGGEVQRVTLHEDDAWDEVAMDRVLTVHEGLEALNAVDPDLAQTVELRFFGGLTNAEVAEVQKSSLRSVERSWQFAKAWLQAHFAEGGDG